MPTVLHVGATSGLIIAFVVAVWAAYFVPLVLRRYDEAGRHATVEEAGTTGRIHRVRSCWVRAMLGRL